MSNEAIYQEFKSLVNKAIQNKTDFEVHGLRGLLRFISSQAELKIQAARFEATTSDELMTQMIQRYIDEVSSMKLPCADKVGVGDE